MRHRAGDFGGMEGRPQIYQVSQEAGKEGAPLRKAVRSPHENARGQTPTAVRTERNRTQKLGKSTGRSLAVLDVFPGYHGSEGHHGPPKLGGGGLAGF